MTFKRKNWFHRDNGRKGGRPRQDSKICMNIPNVTLVNLTSNQYETLIKKYGSKKLNLALKILDNWLKSGSPASFGHLGKNNYGYFRSDGWVINEADKLLHQENPLHYEKLS